MMSNPSNCVILRAKRKFSEVSQMDVDDDTQTSTGGQSANIVGTGSGGSSGFVAPRPYAFGTPAPTAANQFPLPPPVQASLNPVFGTHGPSAVSGISSPPGFLSQSEGAMFSQPKRFHSSHLSLQQQSTSNKYISVPDSQGIQRNVPVNDQQLQEVVQILSKQQGVGYGGVQVQQPSLGSLPSGVSTQSVLTTHSSQSSLGAVSTGSTDLPTFLNQQLLNQPSWDEILHARQMLDEQLMHFTEVSQDSQTADSSVDLNKTALSVETSQPVLTSVQISCGQTDNRETSSARKCYKNVTDQPKLGVLAKLIRKLVHSKL